MNILYLAHRIPYPPTKGDKLRAYHQLVQLAKHHRVWCACFVDDPADQRYVPELARMCHEVAALRLRPTAGLTRGLLGLARGGTLTEAYYRRRDMQEVLKRWGREVAFDAAVAFSSSMAPYALDVSAKRRVLDLCDLDSAKWLEYSRASGGLVAALYRLEARRLAQRECSWARRFDATVLITRAEAADLRRMARGTSVHVVSNGVTLPAPTPAPPEPIVGFMGMMDYKPNVDAVEYFVREVWPRVRAECPEARFRIMGRRPVGAVRALAREPGVEVTGGVPDAAAAVAELAVSVAPLRIARGLQNKVLEAMAVGRPVVASPAAARGLTKAEVGRDLLCANDAAGFAEMVIALLRDGRLRHRVGTAGRAYVERAHRWPDHLARFEALVTGEPERDEGNDTRTASHPAVMAGTTHTAALLAGS